MPDLDILGKSVSYAMAPAYRLIRRGAGLGDVRSACTQGLAESLRRGGGIPAMRERATLIAAVGAGSMSQGSALAASRDLTRADQGARHAHLAHAAMQRMLADGLRPTNVAEIEHLLARYAMHQLLDHRLFSCVRTEAPEVGMSADQFYEYEQNLHEQLEPAIHALATQLIADPSGAGVRAPAPPRSERRARPDTLAILEQEV